MCEMNDVLEFPDKWECVTCGHEWPREATPEAAASPRVVKDAHGNVLADGDCVILIKDLKLSGTLVLKGGSKSKAIRLVDGHHEISCKVDNIVVGLKACFVKKAKCAPSHGTHLLVSGSGSPVSIRLFRLASNNGQPLETDCSSFEPGLSISCRIVSFTDAPCCSSE
jgi:protein PhnA